VISIRFRAALATAGLLVAGAAGCVTMPPADLALAIASSPDPALSRTVHYAITVTDAGPGDASGLAVHDRLPDGFAISSASGPGWTCSAVGQDVTCLSAALSATESSQIAVVATAPAGAGAGAVSSTAVITAATPDDNPDNNIATAVTTMGGCVAAPGARCAAR
jgi:uncharacterized repeat protein (TIGR01451 family)